MALTMTQNGALCRATWGTSDIFQLGPFEISANTRRKKMNTTSGRFILFYPRRRWHPYCLNFTTTNLFLSMLLQKYYMGGQWRECNARLASINLSSAVPYPRQGNSDFI
jgi:hypothetical protein